MYNWGDMNVMKNLFRILAVALLVVLLSASAALAKRERLTGDKFKVPRAEEGSNPTVPTVYLLVGLIGIGVITFKSSRRSRTR